MNADGAFFWFLRLLGVAGIVYETLGEKVDRPWLLGVFMLFIAGADAIDAYVKRRLK